MSWRRRRTGNGNGTTSRKDVIMLDYDSWQQVKEECHNEAQVSFQRMSEPAQAAMIKAHKAGAVIDALGLDGVWFHPSYPMWRLGTIYRVSPTWPGPAKPELKPEYVDQKVIMGKGMYYIEVPNRTSALWNINAASSMFGFVGYVYEADGKDIYLYGLVFDQKPDGTHRLRVPKAVRFLKGATA